MNESTTKTQEKTMQLIITVKDGATNVEMANQLRWQANLIEGMEPKAAAATTNTGKKTKPAVKAAAAETTDDDDGFVTEQAAGEPEGFEDDAATEDEGFTEEPPKKAGAKGTKAKKITLDDVNDACKAHAAAKGRPATLGVLQKKFKTQSVTALKPEQYEACISAMAVN